MRVCGRRRCFGRREFEIKERGVGEEGEMWGGKKGEICFGVWSLRSRNLLVQMMVLRLYEGFCCRTYYLFPTCDIWSLSIRALSPSLGCWFIGRSSTRSRSARKLRKLHLIGIAYGLHGLLWRMFKDFCPRLVVLNKTGAQKGVDPRHAKTNL